MDQGLNDMVERARRQLKGRRIADIPVLRMDERGRRKAYEHMRHGHNWQTANGGEFVQWQDEMTRFFSERG